MMFECWKFGMLMTYRYDVYLNYAKAGGRRVAIVDPPELAWEAQIEEETLYPNLSPTEQEKHQSLVFHGHSRSGNVTGPLIYANYGSRADFKALADSGIDVKGAVVLVRYYGTQGDRALKVKAAELAGAVACIMYSDPNEDGFKRGPAWPEGRFRPSDSVQRGAVSLMSWVVGDVLTPGYASTKNAPRISKDDNPGLVNIPSIPLAWRDAQRLLQVLKNHGQKVPEEWIGGVPNVGEWWTGDQTSPIVHLKNDQDERENQEIWNVLGRIKGWEQEDKTIIVGNHRDAWCVGGADPGSGTAVFLEIVRIFGELMKLGWQPARSITFASWDGEEYNLIGSTEWVEDNIDDLRRNAMAYLNVDVAVSGPEFRVSASPIFQRSLLHVLDRTSDPNINRTLRSIWDATGNKIKGLGAGSDYVAFQDIAGTASIDFGFTGPGFPYHSCYDNFEWMTKYGDPGFQYHKTLAQIWALLILDFADRPIMPFDFIAYAKAVKQWVSDLQDYADSNGKPWDGQFDTKVLQQAAVQFEISALTFHNWEREWIDAAYGGTGMESNQYAIHRMSHNIRMANFDTHLLDLEKGGGVSFPIL
jgi:hypothetical protein